MRTNKKHKHFVGHQHTRHQSSLIAAAMQHLGIFGVEVLMIDFRRPIPVISVAHTSGVERVRHESKGQGQDDRGHYVRKVAHVAGCLVEWDEVVG